jgi:hypothetical protein
MRQTFYLLLRFTFTTTIPYKILYSICSFPYCSSCMKKGCITVPSLKPFHPRSLAGHDFLSFEQLTQLVFDLFFFMTIAPCGTTGSESRQSFLEFPDLSSRRPKRFITPGYEALCHTFSLFHVVCVFVCSFIPSVQSFPTTSL